MSHKLLGFDQGKQVKRNAMVFSTFAFLPILGVLAFVMFIIAASAPESIDHLFGTESVWGWVGDHRATLLYVSGVVATASLGMAIWLYKKLPDASVHRLLAALGL